MMKAILILRPDHLGDILLTTPAIRALRRSFPDHQVLVAAAAAGEIALEGNPCVSRVLPLDCPWLVRGGRASYRRLVGQIAAIRTLQVDTLINFRVAAKEALVARLCGAQRRWGFQAPKSAWAHTDRVPLDLDRHVVENQLDLVEALGGTRDDGGLEYHGGGTALPPDIAALGERSYVVISPGAGYPMKLWAVDQWRSLCTWIGEELNAALVVTGAPGEEALAAEVARDLPGTVINVAGRLTIPGLADILRAARLLVTVDSGTLHLAVAVRTPLVTLFGPTNPRHWGPYLTGRPAVVVTENPDGPHYKQDCDAARATMERIADAVVRNISLSDPNEQALAERLKNLVSSRLRAGDPATKGAARVGRVSDRAWLSLS